MEKIQHFSIRKLSIGAASVLIGISFLGVKASTVKADSLQNTSKAELTQSKAANEGIKQDTSSNIEQDTGSNIKQEPTSNIKKDTNSNIKQEPVSKVDAKQITNDQPNTDQAPAKPASPKPNSNQQNVADLEAKPQVPDKAKLQTNSVITPNEADHTEVKPTTLMAIAGKKLNAQMLSESKVMSPANDTNGGFDEATWGKLNVNDWQGSVQGDYYQLTDYTGDANHVIVPNEADFEKAGISTSGKQVGVTSSLMRTIFEDKTTAQDATVAFSKTDNKQVKAIGTDWRNTWGHDSYFDFVSFSFIYPKGTLTKFDGSNLDVANVTGMGEMFYGNKISDLSPLANWNVNNVTDMHGMFSTNQISDLRPLSNWNTGKVTNSQYMFDSNQISDLSPLANWNVNNVVDMSSMFADNQIGDLSPLANWKVEQVGYMSEMFDNNSSTQTKTTPANRVINFIYPTGYTGKKQDPVTQTIDVPTEEAKVELTTKDSKPSNNILDWVTKTETPISTPTDPVYFQDYTVPEIKGLLEPDKTVISKQEADITKPINVTVTYKLVDSNTNDAYALDSKHGLHEHANVNDNGGYDKDYWGKINVDNWNYTVNGDRIEINGLKDGASTGVNDAVIVPNLDDFKLAGKDGGAKTIYISSSALGETAKHKYYGLSKTNGNTFATDSNLNSAFRDDINLTHADLNSLNTGNVTNMSVMFYSASNLTSLDVSKWKTGNVTDMSYMFYNASGLTSLDVSKWKTGNVNNMSGMFDGASSLTSLDVSKWDTGNVNNMSSMFDGASSLTSLDVSNWDTGKTTNMSWMFEDASGLTNLDVSNWKTGNVTNMHSMFSSASSLTSLDVSNWDTGNVNNMSGMFDGASSLTSLDVSKWDTGNVTDMSWMFGSDSNLTSLDVSKWKTGNVTDMSYMFYNASGLTNLDVSNWDTGNVTYMGSMFNGASGLTSLDVSNWDTGKTTNMSWMFEDASGLTNLDVSNWKTGNVTNMHSMFSSASSLTSLDVSNWDTGNVNNMSGMFDGASSLTSLDVSKWDTGNVTDMSWMFGSDSNLTSLDVSKWKTGNVTDMSYMFYNASGLTNLDVSNWDTGNVTYMGSMFNGASGLALIVNGDKFADYLVNHDRFDKSNVDSGVKSVTTDNAKLLQLLTNDSQHNSATRTIVFTFPANYSPDLAKYHLIKVDNTYQIKQSADYDKPYLQGTVLINATEDITKHHIDAIKPYKLSDTWQPNYDKLVLAHKNSDGSVSFDAIRLPKVPGYKASVKTIPNPVAPASALFAVSFMALPKPTTPVINDTKPVKTVTPVTPATTETAELIKTEPKAATTPVAIKTIDLSDDAVTVTPKETTWKVANEPERDTYRVFNGQYAVELPHINNAQLHVIANDSTKDSVLFTYKEQNTKYVFNIKFVNGHYLLTTYKIKSGKLVKLIDYNFVKSSKMIDVILDWLQLK